jgi:hypothetical protein
MPGEVGDHLPSPSRADPGGARRHHHQGEGPRADHTRSRTARPLPPTGQDPCVPRKPVTLPSQKPGGLLHHQADRAQHGGLSSTRTPLPRSTRPPASGSRPPSPAAASHGAARRVPSSPGSSTSGRRRRRRRCQPGPSSSASTTRTYVVPSPTQQRVWSAAGPVRRRADGTQEGEERARGHPSWWPRPPQVRCPCYGGKLSETCG